MTASRLLDFGVTNDQAWESDLACGGKIQIFVERVGNEGGILDRVVPPSVSTVCRLRPISPRVGNCSKASSRG